MGEDQENAVNMSGFSVSNFGGVIPRLGTRLLPTNAAQSSQNTKLFSGELRSWYKPLLINTPTKGGSLKSAYRMYSTAADFWLSWTDDVDVVKGPIAGDTLFKLYYTGDSTGTGGPKKTTLNLATSGGTDYPHDYLELGVPAPGSQPTVIGTGGTSTVSVSRTYLYTYVTATASWAEEGPPSPLGTGTGKADATWIIAALSTGTSGKYDLGTGAAVKRVYRALTDNAGNTNFQLALDNVPMVTTSTADTITDANLGVVAPSFTPGIVGSEWVAPPTDMKGLIALPNGIMAGFSGNQVCFCEPFRPHAWPIRYRLATTFDIVSLGAYGQTLIVTTKGFPYAIAGSRPDTMAMAKIEENLPCVSKRGTVSFPFGVAWPTPDGLALAGVGGAINAIDQYMKRDEWRAQCFPDTIFARQYLDVYFGFFNNGTTGLNFVFDKQNQQGPLTFGNFGCQGAWFDPETAKLYLINNGSIYQFDADLNNLTPFDWRSKTFVLPKPVNFGAMIVDADYAQLSINSTQTAQASADLAVNTSIIGTGSQQDTNNLTAWLGTTVYHTASGTSAAASVVKSVGGAVMAVCIAAGTSGGSEPTWAGTLGGTATDNGIKWKSIWDIQGVTKGSLRGAVLRNHTQYTTADPPLDGTAGNAWGFPLRGSLLVGGANSTFDTRNLLLQVYAQSTAGDSGPSLVSSQNLTSRAPVRLPKGFKSDTWEIRISGNIATRYFKLAETSIELGQIS